MLRAPVRITAEQTLSDDWYLLKKYSFELQRRDGTWQAQTREVYDRGNGATLLLYNPQQRKVLLIRQFRMPTYVNEYGGYLIETAAGLLDNASPEERIRREAEEETGYRVGKVEKIYEAFMSPGSVTERIHFFIAEYSPQDRVSDGGGLEAEGEDIEVLELDYEQALAMVRSGEIVDGKTIMLLQYLELRLMPPRSQTILVAGPHRSEVGDDPLLLQRNVEVVEAAVEQLLAAGHLPLPGEWAALPMTRLAGAPASDDDLQHPRLQAYAERLLERCDAVLRVGGASVGADALVVLAERLGLNIYHTLAAVPAANA